MPELQSAGVFIEETASTTQVVGPVSTSTMGTVFWTPQGPSNVATLVTSFNQFVQTFGTFDRRSFGAYSMAAFFANGGNRAYVVRVTPSDATKAGAQVRSLTTDQQIEVGDGATTAFTKTASTSVLKDNSGASPLVAGSFTMRWRGKAAVQTGVATKKRDGSTTLNTSTGVLKYEGVLTLGLPAVDPHLFAVVPDGTAVIGWTSSSASKTITIAAPVSGTVGVGTNGAGSAATLDYRTGRFSLLIAVSETPDNAVGVTGTYYPATATYSVTDDGAGNLPAGSVLSGAGTISYTTGAYSFTTLSTTHIPHIHGPILAVYQIEDWIVSPISAGVWGNALKLQITGSQNYYTAATQSYSRYNVSVLQTDSNGVDQTMETYEDLVFDDPTDAASAAETINEFSSLVSIATPNGDEAVGQLNGIPFTLVLCGGDDSDTGRLIQQTLPTAGLPVGKRSVVITYTDSASVARTIKDDGKGNLTGDIDTSYTGGTANTVNYTTGALDFKTIAVAGPAGIKADTLVSVSWYSAPAETTHTEDFADTTKSYAVGSDGTFDTNHFSSLQFTDISLAPDYQGLYALDRIDELMQVTVPDFAGDVTVTGELLDYAATHASSSSGGDRFIILSVPKGSSATDAVDWFRNKLLRFSDYAALYWPWVNVADPLANGRKLTMPVVGHVAGIYARTDNRRNVGKSPGGTVDGALNFIQSLEIVPTKGERDTVYPNRINPLISSAQTGLAVWGVRTISQTSTWKYINARRLFMFLEKSIYNSTFWVVFENNGPALWSRIKGQLDGFLLGLFNDGYFAGATPNQAFFTICDNTNNTPSSINQGVVNTTVGAAPNVPAEFAVFGFQQVTNS